MACKFIGRWVLTGLDGRLNHSSFDINGFKGGVQWVRGSTVTTLDSKEKLLVWEAPDGVGGATVHKDVFSSTDKESGKKTTKDSFVITIVKEIDGKRKVSELVEVETER